MNKFRVKLTAAVITEPFTNSELLTDLEIKLPTDSTLSAFMCRYFAGTIIEKGLSCRKFDQGQEVVGCLSLESALTLEDLNAKTVLVEERYLVPLKAEVSPKIAAVLASVAVRAYTSLFEKGRFVKGSSVMVLAGGNNIGLLVSQLVSRIGGRLIVFVNSVEELNFLKKYEGSINGKIYLTGNEEVNDIVREETLGLGVDIILDFFESHTTEDKRRAIECLSPNGRWVTIDGNIELHTPETKQLTYRNASVSFMFEEAYNLFGLEYGKTLAMVENVLEMWYERKLDVVIKDEIDGVAELEGLVKGGELTGLGKLGTTLVNIS